jgi:prepilin-type processing-associated H-X9-DG protein
MSCIPHCRLAYIGLGTMGFTARLHIAFGDGHVETHRWGTLGAPWVPRDDFDAPNDPDVLWLQRHATWRETTPPGR